MTDDNKQSMAKVDEVTDILKERVNRLMDRRFESPPERHVEPAPKLSCRMRCYLHVRYFIGTATIGGIFYWLVKWVLRKPMTWILDHGYGFLSTVLSKRIGSDALTIRRKICAECSKLKTVKGHDYCAACGCPRWPLARMSYTLPKDGFNCSLGLHPGSHKMTKGSFRYGT